MKIIIVDDHKIIRDGLRVLLERDAAQQVVGEAADGRAGVDLVLKLKPDVVIMDMAMPELNGIEASRQLRAAGYVGGVVMLSSHNERRFVIQAREAGADAYVHKEYAFEQVRTAIAAAVRRESYLSPDLAAQQDDGRLTGVADRLTARERPRTRGAPDARRMLAEGQSVKEIACHFDISPKTIETHRMNLMTKLQVDNLADLTRLAVLEGLAKM